MLLRAAADRSLRAALAALLLLAAGACSLALDFDDECSIDFDCKRLGVNLRCRTGLCVAVTAGADAAGGETATQEKTFADLKSEECPEIYGVEEGDVVDKSVVLLGTVFPKSGALAAYGVHMENAAKLGVGEINENGGIGGGRKLALLCCDSGSDKTVSAAAAQKLADTSIVGGMIGPAGSSNVIEVYTKVAKANDLMLITPAATSAAITNVDAEDKLIWRTVPSDEHQGAALASLIEHLGHNKVGVLNRSDAYGSEFANSLYRALCGSTGKRTCDETNYLSREFDPENPDSNLPQATADLVEFAPDVTVVIAFPDNGINFMNAASKEGLKRFLLTDGLRDKSVMEGMDDLEAKCKVLGTVPGIPPSDALDAFNQRYMRKWAAEPTTFTATSYDALYLLAYAATAAVAALNEDQLPVTGSQLSAAMKRLSAHSTVPPGTEKWNTAVQILRSDAAAEIDYEGVSGPLNFDSETEEAPGAIEAWRFLPNVGKITNLGIIRTASEVFVPPEDVPDNPDADCLKFNDGGSGDEQ